MLRIAKTRLKNLILKMLKYLTCARFKHFRDLFRNMSMKILCDRAWLKFCQSLIVCGLVLVIHRFCGQWWDWHPHISRFQSTTVLAIYHTLIPNLMTIDLYYQFKIGGLRRGDTNDPKIAQAIQSLLTTLAETVDRVSQPEHWPEWLKTSC